MEVIASGAAVTQVVAQAITVVQHIRETVTRIKDAPGYLVNSRSQLDGFMNILALVRDEDELQTSGIRDNLISLSSTSQEIQVFLDLFEKRQLQSEVRQFIRVITGGQPEQKKIEELFARLDRGLAHLNTEILMTNVGITSNTQGNLIAVWPIIQRVDENVQKIIGRRMAIAEALEQNSPRYLHADMTLNLDASDAKATGLPPSLKVQYDGNEGYDTATVVNGSLGQTEYSATVDTSITYRGNHGHNQALVINGPISDAAIAAITNRHRA